jgi:signal transduction histidine kinase
MTNKNKIFPLFQKIIDRCSLNRGNLPTDLKQWQKLFDRVNSSFFDFEQERYLLERSMEISSAEFLEVNEQFENAEAIAHIGHWHYWPEHDRRAWSKEAYRIFGIDAGCQLPGKKKFLQYIFEDDRSRFQQLHEAALKDGKEYEIEMRIYFQKDQSVRWVFAKCKPLLINSINSSQNLFHYNLSGIVKDINEQKKSERKLLELNTQMIEWSHQLGVSEVSISAMHHIGNILNSANMSLLMLQEMLNTGQLHKLEKVSQLIQEGIVKNPEYLLSDARGKLIPEFLVNLSKSLIVNETKMVNVLEELVSHITRIKNDLAFQSDISASASVKEEISIEDICNHAIQLTYFSEENEGIQIRKQFVYTGPVLADKTKMLFILTSLLRNAEKSLQMCVTQQSKIIDFIVRKSSDEIFIEIQVADNGVGLEKDELKEILTIECMTKLKEQDFRLPACAVVAKEMGGSLTVESQGRNQGATFIFKLPIK